MIEFEFMAPVKMTAEAQRQFPISARKGIYGIVLGEGRSGRCFRIRKVGYRTTSSWSGTFWEPCTPEESNMINDANRYQISVEPKKN